VVGKTAHSCKPQPARSLRSSCFSALCQIKTTLYDSHMFRWLRKRIAERQTKTENFFCGAVSAFAQKTDENAYLAAFITGVVVHPTTRTDFIRYLGWVAGSVSVQKPELADQLTQLAALLSSRNWSITDERPIRDTLKAKDYEYWLAYCYRDAAVFQKRHGDLAVLKMEDLIAAHNQLHGAFNDPLVVCNLSKNEPELYQKLVRLGIIASEPGATP
jgi:hypothetical protein